MNARVEQLLDVCDFAAILKPPHADVFAACGRLPFRTHGLVSIAFRRDDESLRLPIGP
jgi:hypothetical protein